MFELIPVLYCTEDSSHLMFVKANKNFKYVIFFILYSLQLSIVYNEEDYIDAVDNILKHVLKKQVKIEYHFDIIYVNLTYIFLKKIPLNINLARLHLLHKTCLVDTLQWVVQS